MLTSYRKENAPFSIPPSALGSVNSSQLVHGASGRRDGYRGGRQHPRRFTSKRHPRWRRRLQRTRCTLACLHWAYEFRFGAEKSHTCGTHGHARRRLWLSGILPKEYTREHWSRWYHAHSGAASEETPPRGAPGTAPLANGTPWRHNMAPKAVGD